MLNDRNNSAVSTALANVGLTAFQIAVVQAKVFKKTLEDVGNRADQTAKELERKAEERDKELRARLADQRGGVDIVVDGSKSDKSSSSKTNTANTDKSTNASAQKNGGVDITV